MKSRSLSFLLLPLLPACATVHDWNELQTAPMTQAECYDGVVFVAESGGFAPDHPNCDRGLGTWQSRWRTRNTPIFGVSRYRLRTEVMFDEGSSESGWRIRYVVEQQKVEDPRRRDDPAPEDWSDDGQDREREGLFGDRLQRKLAPK
ncbi:MAG: hypothetical protein KDE27_24200, partial [Planctomycetes bacterium]|nr:hypothetical protein [Planctomycetota bacterium]